MIYDLPSAYHTSAARPGAFRLLRDAVREVRSRRHLIGYLARADMKKKGVDTLFGNVWWILDPLLQMTVYVILVTVVFRRSTPDFPLFVFAAILPWKWFMTSVSDAITSVSGQDKLIKQVMFPKIVLPLGILLSGVAQFAFGLIPLIGMLVLFYPARIHLTLVWIPVVAVVQIAFTLAVGIIASAVSVFFRDIGNLSRHLLRLWFYLSPVLYGQDTVTSLAGNHKYIGGAMELNPFYPILNGYRNAIYEGVAPDLGSLGWVLLGSLVVLAVAVVFFKRVEPAFAKIL